MAADAPSPWGYKWRSSMVLVVSTACIAMFTETLLYGFVVPILPYMLEERLHQDPSETQRLTAALLGMHGFVSLVSAPVAAHFGDRTPNRKTPLLLSLGLCVIGTLLVAFTPGLWALFLGRVFQGIAGSAAWIVCLAMLTDAAGTENTGKTMGLIMSFVVAGLIGGPMVAGALLEWLGYWPTWSVPLIVLCLDILARLIMIESRPNVSQAANSPPVTSNRPSTDIENAEITPLLETMAEGEPTATAKPSERQTDGGEASFGSFYYIMLKDVRVLVSLMNVTTFSAVIAGFNTTLPVHLRQIFDWGPLSVGTVFFILQAPSVALGTFSGWLRDRVGLKYPTTAGWLFLTPLLWCLGIPGESKFPWASADEGGKGLFLFCIAGVGVVAPFIRGAGFLQTIAVAQEFQAKDPGIFGAYGGNSRAFAINEVGFNLGLLVGPVLSGTLSEAVGYYYMSVILAVIALIVAISSFRVFD